MSVPARRTHAAPAVAPPSPGSGPRRAGTERAPAARRTPGSATTTLRRARRRRHHVGFAMLASTLVGLMVLGIVSLNALLAQTSFRIDEAERRIEQLTREHVDLVREQASLSAPGRIADWARRNGMRLPDDIRSLHASGGSRAAPAGVADTSSPEEPTA